MTDAERRLWARVRLKQLNGCQFYRQRIIGHYIVDFYCSRARLVIEVDGGQHYSGEVVEADRERDTYLANCGLRVLRFTNIDVVNNMEGVLENIIENMRASK